MRNFVLALIISILLLSAVVNAGWIDKQGNKISDSDNMKSVDNLIAQLILTDKETEIFKNWDTPSESVYFPTIDRIEKNKILTAVVVFGGCAVDTKGNCDLVMQITVYQPDGGIYSKLPVMEVWSGKPLPPNNTLGLSKDYIRIIIEPHEPAGRYKVNTKVIDRVSGNSMVLTAYFTAIEPK